MKTLEVDQVVEVNCASKKNKVTLNEWGIET